MRSPLQFFYCPHTYSTQIEGCAIVSFRFCFTVFGLSLKQKFRNKAWRSVRSSIFLKKLYQLHELIQVDVWGHTGQCAQRKVSLRLFGFRIFDFYTVGDATTDLSTFYRNGFYLFGFKLWGKKGTIT